jgi:diketogulonate reductase-like aldo/keto reductase
MPSQMADTSRTVDRITKNRGVVVPTFLYGTAWKEDQSGALTHLALSCGFLGIDTANQRRHYDEAAVGKAVRQALAEGDLKRSELFLQTKFTFAAGQDHRLPYNPAADVTTQVQQSFDNSLGHFKTAYLNSYILHGPASSRGLTDADWEAWRAMETLQKSGTVKLIGISNVGYDQLQLLIEKSEVKPAFVQNRCFARTRWDAAIRELCRSNDMIYQGFSLLTANATFLNRPEIQQISQRRGCSAAQIVFRFALQAGMIPLTGTTNEGHMKEDLAVYDFELSQAEVDTVENIALN